MIASASCSMAVLSISFSLLITVWVTPKIACGVGAITAFLFYGGFFGFPNGAICQRVAS
jgi:hypothetical protein